MAKRARWSWKRRLLMAASMLLVLLVVSTCTSPPALPPGIAKETHRLDCAGQKVTVDFYFQADAPPQPQVVVAHGFTRNRRYMAGWGVELARRGLISAVPTQPSWASHMKNGRALASLLEQGRQGKWPVKARGNGKTALVGFSMGGHTTLRAAAELEQPVDAWVGLDPVDMNGDGAEAARKARAPGLALLAEPATFNRDGNALSLLANYDGPLQILRLSGATHCDPESPTDLLGQIACGPTDPVRRALFLSIAAAFLEARLLGKGDSTIPPAGPVIKITLPKPPSKPS